MLDPTIDFAITLTAIFPVELVRAIRNKGGGGTKYDGLRCNCSLGVVVDQRVAIRISVGINSAAQSDRIGLDVSADRGIVIPEVVVVLRPRGALRGFSRRRPVRLACGRSNDIG